MRRLSGLRSGGAEPSGRGGGATRQGWRSGSDDASAEDSGQASVELALCLPLVAVLLLLVVQAGMIVVDQVAVVQAAREGARRASVDPDPDAARHAALGGRLVPGRTTVTVERLTGSPEQARVTVAHRAATDVPIVGRMLPDLDLSASATMAVEAG